MADMAQTELEVKNAHGLHARPAALFVQKASQFSSTIILRNLSRGSKEANAKSIMEVLMAGVDQGARIELVAEGEDAERAVEALTDLVRDGLEGA
jgi:phosphotransferase system HPr (HPr) family protein